MFSVTVLFGSKLLHNWLSLSPQQVQPSEHRALYRGELAGPAPLHPAGADGWRRPEILPEGDTAETGKGRVNCVLFRELLPQGKHLKLIYTGTISQPFRWSQHFCCYKTTVEAGARRIGNKCCWGYAEVPHPWTLLDNIADTTYRKNKSKV